MFRAHKLYPIFTSKELSIWSIFRVPHESVIAAVGGDAVAAGQDTVTIGLVQNDGKDHGGYSIIVGDATFEASAQSPEAGGAVAAANTVLTVSGADFIIEYASSHGGRGPNDAWASSELDFQADGAR